MSRRNTFAMSIAAALLWIAPLAHAQTPARGTLLVTVADPSGGVIPGAKVTITGQDEGTRAIVAPVVTSAIGRAAFEGLAPGRYTVQAEFSGFETQVAKDVRVRSGENRRALTLPIKKVAEDVVVGRDKQSAALDPLGDAFSTVLTRQQIAALPDDPDEMETALKAMAPPGASIRVDGFSGGKLPPKSQIRSIRLPRMDMLAAQNHGGVNAMMHIDITTQPGLGPLRGSTDFTFRDGSLNARNPFTPSKGAEGLRQYGGSLSGSLVQGKTSFSLSAQGGAQHDTGNLLAALPGGATRAEAIRRPTDRTSFNGSLTTAFKADHTARFTYMRTTSNARNLGVGDYNLPERGFSTDVSDHVFRASESGPLRRRFFSESRLQIRWSSAESRSAIEAPTTRVLDAFTSGGAQQAGGSRALEFEAASDLDYVRGRHSLRTGVLLEGGRYRSNAASNYLGTFTFASMSDYLAGRPAAYTRIVGDPTVRYANVQAGLYVQDDFRLVRSLLLSYGVRYEAQTLIPDQNNLSPRVSLTWSPLKSGKTTFRGGWGAFSDWIGTSTYKQTLLVDGFRQRELNISQPSFPDLDASTGATAPANRYAFGSGVVLPESLSANIGVDQTITPSLRVNATYTYRRGSQLLRGRNLNAPVQGVRPDAAFSNVIEVQSDAASRAHAVNVGANFARLDWHRTFLFANYTWSTGETNTTGAFALPANGDTLATEWGPTTAHHRFMASLNTQLITDLGLSLNVRAQSGSPYTLTTGADNNADGVFNDRPAGVGRNSLVTPSQWDIGARLSYAIGFGTRPQTGAPGGMTMIMIGGGSGMPGGFGGGADTKRYRIEFYASAQNVTNHKNLVGYSGVRTSPFFGLPTNVMNPRKVELGMRFGF